MNNKEKLKQLQKIIDRYVAIMSKLPQGGKIDEATARKIGIPKELKPILDNAYRYGKLQGSTKRRIAAKDIEKNFIKDTKFDGDFLSLSNEISKQDLENVLNKNRGKLTRAVTDTLKRNLSLLDEVFKDEEIPTRYLAGELRKVTGDIQQDWDMVIRTELINRRNHGMANEILQGKSIYSDRGAETEVYKLPNPDCCKHCRRLYLDDKGVPRIFKLSEMLSFGTNVGKKVQDWKPVVGTCHPHCFKDDVEVLTNHGWKLFKDVTNVDMVFTLDPNTKIPEWQYPSVYVEYDYEGKLIHFKNRWYDLSVTPEHNMLIQTSYQKRKKGPYELIQAEELLQRGSGNRIPLSCKWEGIEKEYEYLGGRKVDIETYVKFMAYWLSDGSCTLRDNGKYQIAIWQDNPDWMVKELKKLPFNMQVGKHAITIQDKELGKELIKYGKCNKKYIPEAIKELNPNILKIFLEAYSKCDGHVRKPRMYKGYMTKPSIYFYTTSNQLSADMGEIILKAGYRPSYYLQKNKDKEVKFRNGTYKLNYDVWVIRLNRQVYSTLGGLEMTKEDYKGKVYCVEVPKHHTLYVRSNGKCSWSGNCQCSLHVMPQGCKFDESGNIIIEKEGGR